MNDEPTVEEAVITQVVVELYGAVAETIPFKIKTKKNGTQYSAYPLQAAKTLKLSPMVIAKAITDYLGQNSGLVVESPGFLILK